MRARHKPLQLQIATDLGLEVPPTIITNHPEDVIEFARRQSPPLVAKTVHNKLLPVDAGSRYSAYVLTEGVANRDFAYVDAIRHCPVSFQPYVDKRVELRVTIVGNRVFPVEVRSQETNHTRRDWRRADPHHARYAVHDLPKRVARQSVALVKRLGLNFAALDLILTPDGRYVFLEANPNGAWLWMQTTTGLPIASAMADLLASRESSVARRRPRGARALRASSVSTAVRESPLPVDWRRSLPPVGRAPRGLDRLVSRTASQLQRLVRSAAAPAAALERFRRFARRHRGVDMDLVWERDGYFGSLHYDALLRVPSYGTLSIAFSPERHVPWALRHAHHARESDLLRVNGQTLNVQTVMGYLDSIWRDERLLAGLVDGCLVREAVDARGLEATSSEVRDAVRAFRHQEGLASRAALASWLRRMGWTREDLDFEIGRQVVAAKLRRVVTKGRVREYFAAHRRTFERLDAPARARIEAILFEEWLASRRATATVEWFWGDAERTDPSR